jgi:hypothetical protein
MKTPTSRPTLTSRWIVDANGVLVLVWSVVREEGWLAA